MGKFWVVIAVSVSGLLVASCAFERSIREVSRWHEVRVAAASQRATPGEEHPIGLTAGETVKEATLSCDVWLDPRVHGHAFIRTADTDDGCRLELRSVPVGGTLSVGKAGTTELETVPLTTGFRPGDWSRIVVRISARDGRGSGLVNQDQFTFRATQPRWQKLSVQQGGCPESPVRIRNCSVVLNTRSPRPGAQVGLGVARTVCVMLIIFAGGMAVRRPSVVSGALDSDWLPVTAVLIIMSPLFAAAEHIEANNGLGNDGFYYAEMAKDFPTKLLTERLDGYYIQRISIPAALFYSSRLFHFRLTDQAILKIWTGIDLGCLVAIALFWSRIARILAVSRAGRWMGFLFLFVSFGVLKWTPYYPTLTDIPMYALSLGMLWAYLSGRCGCLSALTFVAAFTWPTAVYIGLVLLLLPKDKTPTAGPAEVRGPLPWALAGGVAASVYFVLQAMHESNGFYLGAETRSCEATVNLGIATTAGYLFAGLGPALTDARLFSPVWLVKRLRFVSPWLGIGMFVAVQAVTGYLRPRPTPLTFTLVGSHILWTSVLMPGVFLVCHAIFYGPVFVLALLTWPRTCAAMRCHGPALAVIACFAVGLGLCSESRRLFHLAPLIIPFVVKVIDDLHWSVGKMGFVAAACVIASKVWLTINPDLWGLLLNLNVGPWLSYQSYIMHGAILLLFGSILWYFVATEDAVRGRIGHASGGVDS